MTTLVHQLDRTILIEAPPEVVFSYFTDERRWAAWWGEGSTIDARPGGRVFIRYPNAVEAGGEVLELQAPDRIIFTYGFATGDPIPIGSSRVTIRLEPNARGTRLHLLHQFADAAARDHHVQGWRYQLSVFANVVMDAQHDPERISDSWFRAWAEPDSTARRSALASLATAGLMMRDRFSSIEGLDDVNTHIDAAHRFMPGMKMERTGSARHCQGMVLADWIATGPDGQPRGRGTNVFLLAPDGRIERVTGFWS